MNNNPEKLKNYFNVIQEKCDSYLKKESESNNHKIILGKICNYKRL